MLTIKAKELAELVGIAAKITAGRSTQPIAESLRVAMGTRGQVAIYATNFESWITVSTPGFAAKDADIAIVPGSALHSLIAKLPGDVDVEMSATKTKMTVKAGSSKYNFGSLPDAEWPQIPEADKFSTFTFKAEELRETLAFVSRAMMGDDGSVQYFLCGVCMRPVAKGKIRFIAADGHQLMQSSLSASRGQLSDDGIIIPRQTVLIYMDMLDRIDPDTKVEMDVAPSKIRLRFEDGFRFSMVGRLIDSTYPDVDRLIPYERKQFLNLLPRQKVIDALDRMAIFTEEKKNGTLLQFTKKDGLKLSKIAERGDGEEFLETSVTEEGSITLNMRYIRNVLGAYKSSDVEILCDGDNFGSGGAVIREIGSPVAQDSRLAMIVPMKG